MTPPTWTPPEHWSPSAAREHLRAWALFLATADSERHLFAKALVGRTLGADGEEILDSPCQFDAIRYIVRDYAAPIAASTPPAPRKRPAVVSARSGGPKSKRR